MFPVPIFPLITIIGIFPSLSPGAIFLPPPPPSSSVPSSDGNNNNPLLLLFNNGTTNDGTTNDAIANDATNDSTANNGITNDGTINDGTAFPPPPPVPLPIWDIVESSHITIHPLRKFTARTYPNPRHPFDHWRCRMDRPGASLCDPDSLLDSAERMELGELASHFPEWTKNPVSVNRCVQRGVQLGIALAQFPIEPVALPLFPNKTHRQWRDWMQDGDARRLTDVIWQRLNELGEDPKDAICAQMAKDWGLLEGCNLAALILAHAEPPAQIHIYTHPSIPISPFEKRAIIAEQQQFLRNAPAHFHRALRAILGALRELIVHKQTVLNGAQIVPIRRAKEAAVAGAGHQNGPACQQKNGCHHGPWHLPLPPLLWLALPFIAVLLSLASFLLTIFLLFRVRQIGHQRRRREEKQPEAPEKAGPKQCHHCCCGIRMGRRNNKNNNLDGGGMMEHA